MPARSHTHWDPDLIERLFLPPYPKAPICDLPTKKACDERYTTYLHGHLGQPCIKEVQPSKSKRGRMNTIATCTIIDLGKQAPQEVSDASS